MSFSAHLGFDCLVTLSPGGQDFSRGSLISALLATRPGGRLALGAIQSQPSLAAPGTAVRVLPLHSKCVVCGAAFPAVCS